MKKTQNRAGRARVIMSGNNPFLDIDIYSEVEKPTQDQYRFLGKGDETILVPANRTIIYIFDKK